MKRTDRENAGKQMEKPDRNPAEKNREVDGSVRNPEEETGEEMMIQSQPAGRSSARTGRGHSKRAGEKQRPPVGILLLIVLCCMIGAGTGIYFSHRPGRDAQKEGLIYEANVIAGDIPGKSREERQRELNSLVEEGMLNMSMNITPSGKATGSDKNRSINWLIENPSNQGKLIRVEIIRDDTGEKIYETGAIRPGNYVESAPLDAKLPAGEYACTAIFFAYQEETEALIGQAAVKIKLTLQE